jgi:hypothetical protein
MKRVRFYELAGIVGLVLQLLGSASSNGSKLSPREKAQVPPPRPKYHIVTNEQKIAEIRMRYATNAPSFKSDKLHFSPQKPNRKWHHPGH